MLKMTRGNNRFLAGKVTGADGAAYNLTGCTLWFTAKRSLSDDDSLAVIRKSNDPGIGGLTVPTPADGQFTVSIILADTYGLSEKDQTPLYYDVQLKTADGSILTLVNSRMAIEPNVTRSS